MSNPSGLDRLRGVLAFGSADNDEPSTRENLTHGRKLTQDLTAALPTLKQLRNQDVDYVKAVQLLADAARNEEWRVPLRTSGVLEDLISHWDPACPQDVSKQILRLIGNCSIDQDNSRSLLANIAFKKIMKVLPKKALCSTATSALYNTCLDSKSAQSVAALLWIHHQLILLACNSAWRLANQAIEYVYELGAMLSSKAASLNSDLLDLSLIPHLAALSTSLDDPFDLGNCIDILISYLGFRCVDFLAQQRENLTCLLNVIDHYSSSSATAEGEQLENDRTEALINLIVEACDDKELLNSSQAVHHASPRLQTWITSRNSPLFDTACILLGNLCLNDRDYAVDSVQKRDTHIHLVKTLNGSSSRSSMHAAAGLLTGLILPAENTQFMFDAADHQGEQVWTAITALVNEKDFTLIKDGLVLLRAFATDSSAACQFLLTDDPDPNESQPQVNRLHKITELCSKMHGNSPFTKDALTACARALVAITRVVLQPAMESLPRSIETMFSDPFLLYPLVETLRYTDDKTIRLQSTVALTKIAFAHDSGAALVASAIENGGLLDVLEKIADSGEKETKSNCKVMVTRVLGTDRTHDPDIRGRMEVLVANTT